jgi:hypothetical protein
VDIEYKVIGMPLIPWKLRVITDVESKYFLCNAEDIVFMMNEILRINMESG